MLGGHVMVCLRWRHSSTSCSRTWTSGHPCARGERRHRAPPSRRRGLGSVPSVVPPEDADADDVRACYPTTATGPGPWQHPVGHHVPSAPRPDRRHSGKQRYCKHISFIWIFIIICVTNFVSNTTCLPRSCSSQRPRGSIALPGGLSSTRARTTWSSMLPWGTPPSWTTPGPQRFLSFRAT
jgi:hypothetical protein